MEEWGGEREATTELQNELEEALDVQRERVGEVLVIPVCLHSKLHPHSFTVRRHGSSEEKKEKEQEERGKRKNLTFYFRVI